MSGRPIEFSIVEVNVLIDTIPFVRRYANCELNCAQIKYEALKGLWQQTHQSFQGFIALYDYASGVTENRNVVVAYEVAYLRLRQANPQMESKFIHGSADAVIPLRVNYYDYSKLNFYVVARKCSYAELRKR